MNIYLASSFKLIEKVEKAAKALEDNGFKITEKWWKRPYQVEGLGVVQTSELKKMYEDLTTEEFYEKPETKLSYECDYKGVKNADIFVFIADDTPRKYNGANVELGIALSDQKPCFSIGTLENSVLYYPIVKCADIQEVISCIFSLKET